MLLADLMTHETLQNENRDNIIKNIFSKSLKHGPFVFIVNILVGRGNSISINKDTKLIRLLFMNKFFHSFKSSQLRSRKFYFVMYLYMCPNILI